MSASSYQSKITLKEIKANLKSLNSKKIAGIGKIRIFNNYKNHLNVKQIEDKYNTVNPFYANQFLSKMFLMIFLRYDTKSSGGVHSFKDLKILQNRSTSFYKWIRGSLITTTFPDPLKWGEIKTTHKKEHTSHKDNYQPIIILFLISKVFEKLCTAKFIAPCSSTSIFALQIQTKLWNSASTFLIHTAKET